MISAHDRNIRQHHQRAAVLNGLAAVVGRCSCLDRVRRRGVIGTSFERHQGLEKQRERDDPWIGRLATQHQRRIGRVVTEFRAQECTNFFRHAGYVRT